MSLKLNCVGKEQMLWQKKYRLKALSSKKVVHLISHYMSVSCAGFEKAHWIMLNLQRDYSVYLKSGSCMCASGCLGEQSVAGKKRLNGCMRLHFGALWIPATMFSGWDPDSLFFFIDWSNSLMRRSYSTAGGSNISDKAFTCIHQITAVAAVNVSIHTTY